MLEVTAVALLYVFTCEFLLLSLLNARPNIVQFDRRTSNRTAACLLCLGSLSFPLTKYETCTRTSLWMRKRGDSVGWNRRKEKKMRNLILEED